MTNQEINNKEELEKIEILMQKQQKFFLSGQTYSVSIRIKKLKLLKQSIHLHMQEIYDALKTDLNKSKEESYMCEVGMVLEEISGCIRNLKKWAKPKKVASPLAQFPSKSYSLPVPKGVVLVISPWNYPFMLALSPLCDAVAAGNTAIVKPSEFSVCTSNIIKKIIKEVFEEEYVCVMLGEKQTSTNLLQQKFNHIFFTGSTKVGKIVQNAASKFLTPVTLELGGKSPCIVDDSANVALAAKRIVFGKFLNAGQTCVAPDYVLCHKSVESELVECLKAEIVKQYGAQPLKTPHFGKMISKQHFERQLNLINKQKVCFGGNINTNTNQIEPTIMTNVNQNDECMKEEIFGPILPVVCFDNFEEVVCNLQKQQSPLALYMFSKNKQNINKITTQVQFGGGCINDCIIHIATTKLGFGGVGNSGMGCYHGKNGFDTFSHQKSIVSKALWLDLPFRYAPYTKFNDQMVKLFLK